MEQNQNFVIELGKRIRFFRLSQGLSQENMSVFLQKSQNWVSQVENGKIRLTDDYVVQICAFLKIDPVLLEAGQIELLDEEKILNFIRKFENISHEIDQLVELKKSIIGKIQSEQ